jgi:hypothetical protein
VWAVVAVLAVAGCGGCGTAAPTTKEGLSEQEKQQLRELDAQRQDEWGKKK